MVKVGKSKRVNEKANNRLSIFNAAIFIFAVAIPIFMCCYCTLWYRLCDCVPLRKVHIDFERIVHSMKHEQPSHRSDLSIFFSLTLSIDFGVWSDFFVYFLGLSKNISRFSLSHNLFISMHSLAHSISLSLFLSLSVSFSASLLITSLYIESLLS